MPSTFFARSRATRLTHVTNRYGKQLLEHLCGFFIGRDSTRDPPEGSGQDGEDDEPSAPPPNAAVLMSTNDDTADGIAVQGSFKVDMARTVRGMGFKIPREDVAKVVLPLLGGKPQIRVSDAMRNLKLSTPGVFDKHRTVVNMSTIEGDISQLMESADVEFYLVAAGTSKEALADAYKEYGVDRFVDKREQSTFSIFCVSTNGCSIETIMSVSEAGKRARLSGEGVKGDH